MVTTIPIDPNVSVLNQSGLAVESNTNTIAFLISALQSIYGNDINVASNTPDGQLINIFGQAITDLNELLLSIYNSFSIQNAYGTQLDQRVALNGIARKQGTYTLANVQVTVTQALTLTGLDALVANPNASVFTVSDNAGNQFQLLTTQAPAYAGVYTYSFRAVTLGQVQTTSNTIANIVTPTLGVSSVNNPSTATDAVGVNEETDAQLKIRHAQSFALASIGAADSVQAALLAYPDITDTYVVENYTGATVGVVPAHSIWAIVEGGTAAEIGQAIYAKKSPGCGQYGSLFYIVTRPNGTSFTAQYDRPVYQNLYLKFSLLWRGGVTLDNTTIIARLAAALTYKLTQSPSVGDIVTALQAIVPTAIVSFPTNTGVSSDGVTYQSIVNPSTVQSKFTLSAGNIQIV